MSKESKVLSTIIDIINADDDRCDSCVLQSIVQIVARYIATKDLCHSYDLED